MKNNFMLPALMMLIFISCKQEINGNFYSNNPDISSRVKHIANKIDQYGTLTGSAVGYSARKPEQWDNFMDLKNTASDQELIVLTNHPSTVVRCYAFDLLRKKRHKKVLEILKNHLKDTSFVFTQFGCIGGGSRVSDYMLRSVNPFSGENIYITDLERKEIDSLIIFDNNISNNYKDQILEDINPEPKLYKKIKELAESGNKSAIVGLAKFNRKEDIELIKSLLKNKRTDIQTFGLKAIINYPSAQFLSDLKEIQSKEIKKTGSFDYILMRYLYQAIVQYKNETSREIIENSITSVTESAKTYHYEYIWLALRMYPHPKYNGLIDKLKLTDYDIKNLEIDWDWEIRN